MTGTEIVLLGAFFLMMFIGVPFALAIGVSSVIALVAAGITPVVVAQQLISGMSMYSLLAIPCFILAGDLMFTAGLSTRLVNIAMVLLGRQPGGAGMVAVASATAPQPRR